MAEQAYQAGVPRDLRRYIGRWAHESVADTYTRDHRSVIGKIWDQVLGAEESLGNEQKLVPQDLNDPHWGLETQQTPGPNVEANAQRSEDSNLQASQETQEVEDMFEDKMELEPTLQMGKTPIDVVSINQGGPMTLAYSKLKKGSPPRHTAHFLCTSGARAGRTAGCNRGLKPAGYTAVPDAEAWKEIADQCILCKFCTAHHTLPAGWHSAPPDEGAESADHMSSEESLAEESDIPPEEETAPKSRRRSQ